nr:EOG090X0AVR [Cyclestheria hislopi]
MINMTLFSTLLSSVGKDGQVAPRTGFFHNFRRKEILARKWSQETEDIVDTISDEDKDRLQCNLKDLDSSLGAYPYQSWKKWISLTNKITVDVIEKIKPLCDKISSVADLIPSENEPEMKKAKRILRANIESTMLPSMQERPGTELRFTSIPSESYPEGATPSQITKYSLDSSYVLEQLLSCWQKSDQLLGELQMAFICFLVGQVYSAFEQWKKLLTILCTADEMLQKNPKLFINFIGDVYFQMQEVSADFFVDIITQDNFLVHIFRIFFSNISENKHLDAQLRKRGHQLEEYLTQRFQWDFSMESEEDAPVVVQLPEESE